MKSLPPLRLTLALVGFVLFAVSLVLILSAENGLVVQRFTVDGLPVSVYTPASGDPRDHPLVLVGHGMAGSEVVMRGFSLTLAHAGYTVAAWDFDGHGANRKRLSSANLLSAPEQVVNALAARRLTERQATAILGHSMGSGVALEYGVEHPFARATIAISPVVRPVTADLPRNLLLMAGTLEPRFAGNARQILAQAGGAQDDFSAGRARAFVPINNVEHITILYAPQAHRQALQWLDAAFGEQPGRRPYTDLRLLWYLLGVAGAVLCAATLAPQSPKAEPTPSPSARANARPAAAPPGQWRLLLSLLSGAAIATLTLWLAARLGVRLGGLLGISVGGYLLLWFGVAGVAAGLVGGVRWNRPRPRDLRGAGVVFLALWIGFGWLGGRVWLNWGLVPERLVLWPAGLALLLPWLLVIGEAASRFGWWGRLLVWLGHSLLLVLALAGAMQLNPELGFLILILPLFPVVLFIHTLAAVPQAGRWGFALSGAGLLSWLILAVFPLV